MDDILRGILKALGEAGLVAVVQGFNKLVTTVTAKLDHLTDDHVKVQAETNPVNVTISTASQGAAMEP